MRTGARIAVAPMLMALAVTGASAQDQEMGLSEALEVLRANGLVVHVAARVIPEGAEPIWNAESTRTTLPGRPIKVRYEGDNLRIYLTCTPYVQDDGEVLLLAQGQVWLSETPDKEVKYYNTFSSIPVSFGEKVLFFPLGFSTEKGGAQELFNIELAIRVVPYDAAR